MGARFSALKDDDGDAGAGAAPAPAAEGSPTNTDSQGLTLVRQRDSDAAAQDDAPAAGKRPRLAREGAGAEGRWPLPPHLTERVMEMLLTEPNARSGEDDDTEADECHVCTRCVIRDCVRAGQTCRSLRAASRVVLRQRVVWCVEVIRTEYDFDEGWTLHEYECGEPVGSVGNISTEVAECCRSHTEAVNMARRTFVKELKFDKYGDRVERKNVAGWPTVDYLSTSPPYDSRDMPKNDRVQFDHQGVRASDIERLDNHDEIMNIMIERDGWWEGPGRDRVRVRIVERICQSRVTPPAVERLAAGFKCDPPRFDFLNDGDSDDDDDDDDDDEGSSDDDDDDSSEVPTSLVEDEDEDEESDGDDDSMPSLADGTDDSQEGISGEDDLPSTENTEDMLARLYEEDSE
ncbi:hypothetical protein RI054_26g108160 [Pseudoscourfieldia marina]